MLKARVFLSPPLLWRISSTGRRSGARRLGGAPARALQGGRRWRRARKRDAKWRSGSVRRRRGGCGDRHDPRRGRAAAEARRCYCRPMELLAGLAATEDEVATTKTREQPPW